MIKCNPPVLIEPESWDYYVDKLYAVYCNIFIEEPITYNNLPIYRNNNLINGKEDTFWHLIEKTASDGNRYPDYDRCKKIAWIKYFILHCSKLCPSIKIWEKLDPKKKKVRTYLWCESFDYVVIMEFRKTHYYFITAFNVIYNHERRKFEKDYQEWYKTKPPI